MLQTDVKVFCSTAESFPNGLQDAFLTLERMLSKEGRTFYGISYKDKNGNIIYKAAVSEIYNGESAQYGFETFTIKSGEYLAETIVEWMDNIKSIGQTFQKLLADPSLDDSYPCIEWYKSDKELICMIRTK